MSRLPKTPLSYREVLTAFPAQRPLPLPLGAKWTGPVPLSHDRMADLVTQARDERARHLGTAIAVLARMAAAPLGVALRVWRTWRQRRREREELAQLDDRALRDIGLSRYDVTMAARGRIHHR